MRAGPQHKKLRCAVYTRVSTEHGLEQEFNSLDNQREAAEAFIKSQAHEGWRLHPARYDDGGFSGGSLDRPALQRLLEHIRSGQIDVVVVYKVDRLTRSLADFAKLVELFDQHGVSFVSVTQAFNTTSSMGRLTLNVLLSFAQFEREVTGERIRDKIAASKKKGLWMGGHVPLGYRVQDRKLLVDDAEAGTVRLVFERYLALGSLPALQRELRDRGVLTRPRTLSSGRVIGGVPFTNGPLAHVLRNRVYLGEINHKGRSHPGEHEAIVSLELFEAVQAQLAANLSGRRARRAGSNALLLSKIFDDRGNPMSPSFAKKGGVRYRYYVSCVLAQGRKEEAGSVARVPAPEMEQMVIAALKSTGAGGGDDQALVAERLARVVVRQGAVEVYTTGSEASAAAVVSVPWLPPRTPRRRTIIAAADSTGDAPAAARPMRAEARARVVQAIARGRAWLDELVSGAVTGVDQIADRAGCSERSVRQGLSLAFLSPRIVQAVLEGTLPRDVGLTRLTDLPPDWSAQWRTIQTSV